MSKIAAREGGSSIKKCAFCEYFYDPTNSVISLKRGQKGVWEYETGVKKPCRMRSNMEIASQTTGCSKFVCKI